MFFEDVGVLVEKRKVMKLSEKFESYRKNEEISRAFRDA